MADNKIVITASLDFTTSTSNITNDLKKIADGLNAEKVLKVVVNADLGKTQTRIQSQLNTISKNLKLDVGNINVGNVNTQNIVSGLKNVQTQAQQTSGTINKTKSELLALNTTFTENTSFKAVREGADNFINLEKTLENARNKLSQFGKVDLTWTKDISGEVNTITAKITEATGIVENFRFVLNGDKFNWDSSSGSDKGVQKLIESIQKAQDKIKALRTNLASDLKTVGQGYLDSNGTKPITDGSHLKALNTQYTHALRVIGELRNADSTTMASMKSNAEKEIDALKRMIKEYQNAEYAATTLRTKDVGTVKINQQNDLNKFIAQVSGSSKVLDIMTKDIEELKVSLASVGDSSSLTNYLNQFDNAKTKFESLKTLYQNVGSYDKQLDKLAQAWQKQGVYAGDVRKTVEGLKASLANVSTADGMTKWVADFNTQISRISDLPTKVMAYKTQLQSAREEWESQHICVGEIAKKATSLGRAIMGIKKPEKLNEWVAQFDELNSKAIQIKANLDKQVQAQNNIYAIQSKLVALDPEKNANEVALLKDKLATQQQILANYQMQANAYSGLISFEEQERYITKETADAREKLLSATAKSEDKSIKQRTSDMQTYQKEINNAIKHLNALNNNTTFRNNSANTDVQIQRQNIQNLITQYETLKTQLQGTMSPEGLRQLGSTLTTLKSQFDVLQGECTELQTSLRNTAALNKFGSDVEVLRNKIIALKDANGKSVKEFGHVYDSLLASTDKMKTSFSQGVIDNETLNATNRQFRILEGNIKNANVAGNGLFKSLWESAKKFSSWMSLTYVISSLVRSIRNAVTSVKEIDSAMTSLKKVTDETSTTYNNFLDGASKRAKELGTTITDLINSTAEFAKLGYSLEDATTLGEVASIYANVGELDIEEASSSIVSTMAAFGIEAEKAIEIVDRFNAVGNQFSITSGDIGGALKRSASSLKTAGNSIDESIAMITAAKMVG